MDSASHAPVPGQIASLVASPRRQRRSYRQRVHSLAYIDLDGANGGIIRNLGEAGLAVQTVIPLAKNQQVQLRFELLNPRTRVEAIGRVAWSDATGQAGLELVDVPSQVRRQLKDWLLTQLLASAHLGSSVDSIFVHGNVGSPQESSIEGSPVPTIELQKATATTEAEEERVELPGLVSERNLPRVIDTLIVLAAVLLFWVMAMALTHVAPSWPVALALAFSSAGVFAALYWYLFVRWIGRTPGMHLAQIAFGNSDRVTELETEERFR